MKITKDIGLETDKSRALLVLCACASVAGCAGMLGAFQSGSAEKQPPVKTEGYVDGFHKQHVGKLLFSTDPIGRDKPEQDKLSTRFDLSKPVHVRAYLGDSVQNYVRSYVTQKIKENQATVRFRFRAGEQVVESTVIQLEENQRDRWLTLPFALSVPNFNKPNWKRSPGQRAFARFLLNVEPQLRSGSVDVRVELLAWASGSGYRGPKSSRAKVIASGTVVVAPSKQQLARQYRGSGYWFPTAGMKSARTLRQGRKVIAAQLRNERWKETLKRCVIQSKQWWVVRHRGSGAILSRKLSVVCGLVEKSGCVWRSFGIVQKHDGRRYQKMQWNGSGGRHLIACISIE